MTETKNLLEDFFEDRFEVQKTQINFFFKVKQYQKNQSPKIKLISHKVKKFLKNKN